MNDRFLLLLVFLIPFTVFVSNIDGTWILDDHSHLENNINIRSFKNIPKILNSSVFEVTSHNAPSQIYRPVVFLSWIIDYKMFGSATYGYHMINNLLHCINVMLLFLFLRLFTQSKTAFIGAMLFGIHPIVTEGVTWMGGRQDPLVCLFSLLNIFLLYKWKNSATGLKYLYISLFAISIPLGLFSKETFLLLPFAAIAVFFITEEGKDRKRYLYPFLTALVVTSVCWAWRTHIVGKLATEFSLKAFAINYSQSIERFLTLFFIPSDTDFLALYEPSMRFSVAHAIRIVLTGASLSALVFWQRKNRMLLAGLAMFLIPLTANAVILDIHGFFSERYFYLPMAGFTLVFVALSAKLVSFIDLKAPKYKRPIIISLAAWMVLLGITAVLRNREWKDEKTLYSSSLLRDPKNYRAHYFMAFYHARNGDRGQEMESYRKSLEIRPDYLLSLNNLAVRLTEEKDFKEAAYRLDTALKIDRTRPKTSYNIGFFHEMKGDRSQAIKWYSQALRLNPGYGLARDALKRLGALPKK